MRRSLSRCSRAAWRKQAQQQHPPALHTSAASNDYDALISDTIEDVKQDLNEVTSSIKAIVTSNKEAMKAYRCDQSDLDSLKAEQESLETSLDLLLQNLLIRNNQRSADYVNAASSCSASHISQCSITPNILTDALKHC
jgi:chromosome segregation ATPase